MGTHSILAVIDPGYKGDVTVTFNGQTVTNGQIVVTAEMASASYDGLKVISATGNISTDSGSADSSSGSSNDGMSITDYLLIVLVVLIVIMAVLVAIRMMRS